MLEVSTCPECGIPASFSAGQAWLNNGDIIQRTSETARMIFMECQNLDPLFANIGIIIGFPVEELVQNISARGAAVYMERLIPDELKGLIRSRQIDLGFLVNSVILYCHVLGFGRYEFVDLRYEGDADDYYKQRVFRPFSVPEAAGNLAGVLSTAVGGEHAVTYEEVAPHLYEFTTSWTEYPDTLKKKLALEGYEHHDGDLELERCAGCGSPKALAGFRWYLEEGIIENVQTGKRMAMLGGEFLDRVFEALRTELGDTIPSVVIEAQRRFTKTGFYSIDQVQNEDEFRTQLALRGLGNLRMIRMGTRGLRLRIENAAAHLLTVGMAQGLYEMALDVDSLVDWEFSKQGELLVEVKPAQKPGFSMR
ncbi:MAG: hypothetical protein AB1384_05010 [Actinomycetota bacterium]